MHMSQAAVMRPFWSAMSYANASGGLLGVVSATTSFDSCCGVSHHQFCLLLWFPTSFRSCCGSPSVLTLVVVRHMF
jgi:hypothetical protein